MAEETSTFHRNHEYLSSIILRLFPKMMQILLKEHMPQRVLKTKYRNNNLHVAFTDAEIALMEQLPNTDNFTVVLCYKILRSEQLVDDPKCNWINEPHDTEIEISDDIQRILCKINELHSKDSKDITEDYFAHFTKTTKEIVSRVDAYLEQDTCHSLYQELQRNMENTVFSTCVQELATAQPIGDIIIISTNEECRRKDRVSRMACVIIDKFPYFLRCIMEKQYTPGQIYSRVAPCLRNFSQDQQNNLQDLSSLGTFDSLDITLMYQLFRYYLTIQAPTKGWGEQPVSSYLTIGDDIERIRILRNTFAHRRDMNMDQITFENYFSQFISVSHRIDIHLENKIIPSCKQLVINCKTCHMDADLQIQKENAMKSLENVKLRFESKPIKFCYGDSFESSLNQLRSLIKEEKFEGNAKIRILILVGNEAEMNTAAQLINEMKHEINNGLVGIELKEAYTGSVVLDVQIEVKYLETDSKLQSVLTRFMERLLHLGILEPHQSTSIEAVLIPTEEYITDLLTKKKISLSTELDMSLLYLDFEVDAKIFKTDESLQSNLLECVTNVLTESKLKEKQRDVIATLLTINNTMKLQIETIPLSLKDKSSKFEKEEKEEEFYLNVENIECMLRIKGLPQNLELSDKNDDPLETKRRGGKKVFIEFKLKCPKTWDALAVVFYMKSHLSQLHGHFHVYNACITSYGTLSLQTSIQETVLISISLELAFQQLLARMLHVCNLHSITNEELFVTAEVLAVSGQEDRKMNKKPLKATYDAKYQFGKGIYQSKAGELLSSACRRGHLEKVEQLIERGYHVNMADMKGHTALTIACERGSESIIQLLINKGAYVDHANEQRQTPLAIACERGNEKIVELLLDNKADVNLIDWSKTTTPTNAKIIKLLKHKGVILPKVVQNENTYLIDACKNASEELVVSLIGECADVNQAGKQGQTPLTAACKKGNTKIIQLLINKGACLDMVDGDGHTPLITACKKGDVKTVKVLIEEGVDVKQTDEKGQTPLSIACEGSYEKIMQLLIGRGADVNQVDEQGHTHLTAACEKGDAKVVHLLIESGAQINKADMMGQTPLIIACNGGRESIIQFLIKKGADVHQFDRHRHTALTVSCMNPNEKVLRLLLEKVADVNKTDWDGLTLLTRACISRNVNVILLLADMGADLNMTDQRYTPLTAACTGGSNQIVRILIDKGADVNVADNGRVTPLTAACMDGNEKIVQLLIDKGASVTNADEIGQPPLAAACSTGNAHIVRLLLENGANVNRANDRKETPLNIACNKGNEDIVQLLIDNGAYVNKTDSRDEENDSV